MRDDLFYRLGAQVQALEMVTKTMIAFHFAAGVKDETGFARAAEQVRSVATHLQEHIDDMVAATPPTEVKDLMGDELRATVRRCFADAESQLEQIAKLILAVSDPASDAKN